MLFMSAEHVHRMNELLESSDEVRRACRALPVARTLSYHLTDGPNGSTVHWTITLGDGMRFGLEPPAQADVTYVGDWTRMMRAAAASRDGASLDPQLTVEGDVQLLQEIGPALELGRKVATVPVTFPQG